MLNQRRFSWHSASGPRRASVNHPRGCNRLHVSDIVTPVHSSIISSREALMKLPEYCLLTPWAGWRLRVSPCGSSVSPTCAISSQARLCSFARAEHLSSAKLNSRSRTLLTFLNTYVPTRLSPVYWIVSGVFPTVVSGFPYSDRGHLLIPHETRSTLLVSSSILSTVPDEAVGHFDKILTVTGPDTCIDGRSSLGIPFVDLGCSAPVGQFRSVTGNYTNMM